MRLFKSLRGSWVVLGLMALMTACKNGPANGQQTAGDSTMVAAPQPKVNADSLRAEQEKLVRMEEATKAIEKQVAEVYQQVDVAYRSSPVGKSIDLDALYCTDDWVKTVDAVRAKDANKQDEPGFFDADYWVMGQDVAGKITATDIAVDSLDLEAGNALVSMHLHNGNEDQPMLLNMVLDKETWRIDDFTTLTPDTFVWKVSMKEYLKGR